VIGRLTARLPPDWTYPPVYARFSVQLGKMLDEKHIVGTHLAPYLRNIDVQWTHINVVDLPEMDFSAEDRERLALLKGDLLVCEGGEVGRTAIWDGQLEECYFQKALHRLRPITAHDEPRFFRYFMWMAVGTGLFELTTASTIQHLPAEKLRVVRYPAPPRRQQRAIADYLDRETARLDSLVAAKERVLALLAEKRRALITSVVTRGLDRDTPLRDSGIPWIGEIPTHWQLKRAKFVFRQSALPVADEDEMVTCFRDGQVTLRRNRREEGFTNANLELGYQGIRAGQLVLHSMDAFAGAIGVSDSDGKCSPEYIICDPRNPETNSYYYGHLLRTMALAGFIQASCPAVRERAPRIRFSDFGEMFIPVPPIDEQRAIAGWVGGELGRLNAFRAANERTIALLKERRDAMIADAVSGRSELA
jgi:type I restriction enzyme, S subunit